MLHRVSGWKHGLHHPAQTMTRPRRTTRLHLEQLEDRLTPSWSSVPPATITPPSTTAVAVTLNAQADATGNAAITANEVDWYKFTATSSGTYTLQATTPSSNLDTVLGVYNSSGGRVAYNDDISGSNRDSRLTVKLVAGSTYYFGITNYKTTAGGSYTWLVDGPTPTTTPPPPTTGGFSITLRISGMTTSQQAIFQQAANRWAQVITGDLPNATYNGVAVDDVLIDASAVYIDGVGKILGQAGPDWVRSNTYMPIHGVMQFDSADLAAMEANGSLYSVILHEMGHVLGSGTLWNTPFRTLLTGKGSSNPLFTGTQTVAAYNQIFGTNVTGVPVENSGGSGTRDAHWRETTFGNELMTGYINGATNPLSRITIASLADMGYQVNLSAADAYTPPGSVAARSGGSGGAAGLYGDDHEDGDEHDHEHLPPIEIGIAAVDGEVALPAKSSVAESPFQTIVSQSPGSVTTLTVAVGTVGSFAAVPHAADTVFSSFEERQVETSAPPSHFAPLTTAHFSQHLEQAIDALFSSGLQHDLWSVWL